MEGCEDREAERVEAELARLEPLAGRLAPGGLRPRRGATARPTQRAPRGVPGPQGRAPPSGKAALA
eukprot:2640554-Alexandrium_andersonii.AAC.1